MKRAQRSIVTLFAVSLLGCVNGVTQVSPVTPPAVQWDSADYSVTNAQPAIVVRVTVQGAPGDSLIIDTVNGVQHQLRLLVPSDPYTVQFGIDARGIVGCPCSYVRSLAATVGAAVAYANLHVDYRP